MRSGESGTIGPIEMFGRPGKMFTPRFGQRKWNWLRGSSPSRCMRVPPPSRVAPCWLESRPSVESAYDVRRHVEHLRELRVRDLAVVALEEVLADDLPVRLELGLPARVEDERVDVEPELGDLRGHRAERVGERLRVARRVHEDERPPRVDGDAAQAELVLREVRLLVRSRRRAQRAVEPVRPGVVRALQRLARPLAARDREAAVAAHVEKRAQLAVRVRVTTIGVRPARAVKNVPGSGSCPRCPTYCQAVRKIRSCSRRRISGSVYQL